MQTPTTPEELEQLLAADRREQRIQLARSMKRRSELSHAEIAHLLQLTADEVMSAFNRELP